MKRIICLSVALCYIIWPNPFLFAGTSTESINWLSFDQAQKNGQDLSKKFLLYFYTDWCGYCRKLEKETFADASVAAYINSHFIPVRINSERLPKVAARYGVGGVPDLRFLTPKGENIARWPGYIEAGKLLPLLEYIQTDNYLKMGYSEFLKKQ